MTVKTLLRSFAAGVITPELYGRLDLVKFQTGLKKALNFYTLPHGPASNRPGTGYVIETRDSTKHSVLIPFIYNTSQTFVLEFGDQYIRFHTNGATLLETGLTITGITKANPGVLTYTGSDPSNGDWMYLAGIGGMTQLNGRYVKVANVDGGANTFELTDIHGGANINTTNYSTYTSGGTASRVYTISSPYLEADLFDLHFTQSADVLTITHPTYQQRELARVSATNWTLSTFASAPTIGTPSAPTVTTGGPGGGTPVGHTYVVTAIASDGLEESLPSATATDSLDLTVVGNYIDVDPPTVTGAIRYNVYKLFNGLYGFIGQTDGTAFRDNNVEADVSKTPPITNDPLSGSGNYPAAVGYFQGRRWFGGTTNKPLNLFATRSGTEKNFTYTIPTQDDDSISVRLTARQNNAIRHIVPLDELLVLTSGSEWRISPQNSDAITPDTISYKPQDYIGASNVQPVVTSSAVVYPEARGGHVREMRYSWESNGYRTNDISLMAPHLFDGFTIKSMAFTRAPYNILWMVRDDGKLLGCTYVPEQEVLGWHLHETEGGEFEAVCSVPEGDEDVLYAVVKRAGINGRTVRYIERLHTRVFDDLEDAFFVDCGLTYSGSATTTITGLWHLEGETLNALADGAVVRDLQVTNGAITLEQEASLVHIGVPITADFETLPLAIETQAYGQGMNKNVNKLHLRLRKSSQVVAGPNFDNLTRVKQRTNEPYGSPPNMMEGVYPLMITPAWSQDGSVCVRQTDPVPVTILSMTMEVATGG